MTKYIIEGTTLSAIGDTIRGKTGETDLIYPVNMPEKIDEVFDAGKQDKLEEMVSLAQTNPYDAFWDLYQDYGKRTNYRRAFNGSDWTENTFKPKYPIIAIGTFTNVFEYNTISNLKQHCLDNNITFDLTQGTSLAGAFGNTAFEYVPDSFGNTPNATSYNRMFYGCKNLKALPKMKSSNVTDFNRMCNSCSVLETIEEIDVSSATIVTEIFTACRVLKEIRFAGTIPISISFASCPQLTAKSLASILRSLYDYTVLKPEDAGKYTLTLHDNTKALLNSQELLDEMGLDGSIPAEELFIVSRGWNLA